MLPFVCHKFSANKFHGVALKSVIKSSRIRVQMLLNVSTNMHIKQACLCKVEQNKTLFLAICMLT